MKVSWPPSSHYASYIIPAACTDVYKLMGFVIRFPNIYVRFLDCYQYWLNVKEFLVLDVCVYCGFVFSFQRLQILHSPAEFLYQTKHQRRIF
jgi:hypothetical protein